MTLLRALILIALNAMLVFILGFGVLLPRLGADEANPLAPSLAIVIMLIIVVPIGALGLVAYGSVRGPRRSWRELGWHTDNLGRHVLSGVLAGAAAVLTVLIIQRGLGQTWSEITTALTAPSLAERMVFIAIGIQAGFIEESLFRGNLLPALQKRLPAWAALLIQAVVFALYHLNFRPVSLLAKTLLGGIFGAVRGRDGSLVGCAVAHAILWSIVGLM